MTGLGPSRRTGVRRKPAPPADVPTLAEREAALLVGEQAALLRRAAEDRREQAADRREELADRREADLLPREGAVRASASAAAQLRKVNERLVVTTVNAQARTDTAEQATAAMSQVAQHDCLTGLPNRSLLADRLEQAMAFALRQGHRVALLFLDLDHFKRVNDTLGHPVGDLVLQSTAGRLRACVRQTDTVCRQGGDEFMLLLSEVLEVEDAVRIARKVVAAMVPRLCIRGHRIAVSVSIGLSLFPDDGADSEALVQAADLALYQAKRDGRNRVRRYTRDLATPPETRG
ncbi:MAG: GGDEF domain-containing protein [Holophaga sp.]|nr:GGDEF domain-containing protein [Holophaga sp.]